MRFVVVDASALIALLSDADAHHADATRQFRALLGDVLRLHPLTLAEVLVHPARHGGIHAALQQRRALEETGIRELEDEDLPRAEDLALARISGLRMPDAVVLASAVRASAQIATFDSRLAAAARERGLHVVGAP